MSTDSGPVDDLIPAELRKLCPPLCVGCDYSLVGLPPGARCPECGTASERNMVTLRGWSPTSITTARKRQLPWFILLIVFFAVLVIVNNSGTRRSVASFVWLACFVLLPLWQLLQRWWSGVDSVTPVRLRVGPNGFEQRLGPGKLNFTPWDRRMVARVKVGPKGRHSLIVKWARSHFVLTTTTQPINFEFDSDPMAAYVLEAVIEDWIRHALSTT